MSGASSQSHFIFLRPSSFNVAIFLGAAWRWLLYVIFLCSPRRQYGKRNKTPLLRKLLGSKKVSFCWLLYPRNGKCYKCTALLEAGLLAHHRVQCIRSLQQRLCNGWVSERVNRGTNELMSIVATELWGGKSAAGPVLPGSSNNNENGCHLLNLTSSILHEHYTWFSKSLK